MSSHPFLVTLLTLVLLAAAPLQGTTKPEDNEEESITFFEVHLQLMASFLPERENGIIQFMKLRELDGESSEFIANFWHTQAGVHRKTALESAIELETKKRMKDIKDTSKMVDDYPNIAFEATKYIYIGYYHDRWSEIERMLSDRVVALQVKQQQLQPQQSLGEKVNERLKELQKEREEWFKNRGSTSPLPAPSNRPDPASTSGDQ